MKTIELISGNQKAQFTTKSVTFDGREYFYSKMSHVTDHADECFYTFTYEDEVKTLPYEKKDSKILTAIFSQVKMLEAAANASETAVNATSETPEKNEAPVQSGEPGEPKEPETEDASLDKKAAKKAEKERLKAEKAAERERKKAEKEKLKAQRAEEDSSLPEPEQSSLNAEEGSEKKRRIKKSLIVFAVIIAVTAVLSLVYFLTLGTQEEPTPINPSAQESEAYDDIDELINDLQ